ncbi:flagellar hook-length control protein FliK [Marinomonas colpomeniae]|uniref:Flagellar hook-length control protein FliK n=1 Tax=Marinomonas colpomeniae TaxID=2774408 RepID=A0ABR8NUV1_9GAMM|nr:flagellar hook-length control protein FliK [Marinomonas colpomeniae]MBD5769830.1 flagellar hook-length control protein FliK [Marinomonas colpomeniae]
MRTDSNTVLSLSSGVPPKASKPPKAPQENEASFDRDFNNAKEILAPKPAPEKALRKADSTAPTPLVATEGVSSKIHQGDVEEGDHISEVVGVKSSDATEIATELSDEGGNVLQFEGDKLPKPVPVAVIEEDTFLPASDLQSNVFQPSIFFDKKEQSQPTEIKLDAGFSSFDGSLVALSADKSSADLGEFSGNLADDGFLVDSSVDKSLVNLNTDKSLVNLDIDESLVNLGADAPLVNGEKVNRSGQFNSDYFNSIDSKSSVTEEVESNVLPLTLSSLVVEPLKANSLSPEAPFIETQNEDELSWVLSQMDGSNSKLAPTNLEFAISPDKAKRDKEYGVTLLAGDIVKSNRAEPTLSSFSMGGTVSPAIADASLNEKLLDSFDVEEMIFIDEPIELRKKEQETLMSRMSVPIDGKVGDEGSTGGLNSSLLNNSGVARPAFNLATATNGPPVNLAMNLPPSHPGWAGEISQKVSWVARDGGHTAHIRLDPPELGSLTVKISVDNDSNTQVSFMAATPQARDLLEGQMSRLRDMLAQQGMDLSRADVDVSQQDASSMQRGMEQNNRSNRGDIASQDELDEDLISSNVSYVSATGVDYYA